MNKNIQIEKKSGTETLFFFIIGFIITLFLKNIVLIFLYLILYPIVLFLFYDIIFQDKIEFFDENKIKKFFKKLKYLIIIDLILIVSMLSFTKLKNIEYFNPRVVKNVIINDGKYYIEACKNGICNIYEEKTIPDCKDKLIVDKKETYNFLGIRLKSNDINKIICKEDFQKK
jgi:hypothetical protein